ncbi:E3 ubiquitin-protein ligase RNF182-like [Xyrauchen texanus]|uniref:E3 ubiquitin-protein ligase RNF182-like n=1 Tax=Xyrauchen texanus TaxID=154827 RepID=UPI00224204BA|nr:E3 ubiquitin-protein ligase RNF182-like [Xyrauchen texanus]
MPSETECGICYRTFNVVRRCPRQLSCKHTFCESCLVTLARSVESSEPRIMCPLCRHSTPLSEATIKDNLPVDEDILELMVTAGSLEGCTDDDEDTEEPDQEASSPRKEDSPPPRSPSGRLMRSIRRLFKQITGESRRNCMTDEDLRDLAMMSCYIV